VWREQQHDNQYKRTKRILVVDDEFDNNLTLKVALKEKIYSSYDENCIIQN